MQPTEILRGHGRDRDAPVTPERQRGEASRRGDLADHELDIIGTALCYVSSETDGQDLARDVHVAESAVWRRLAQNAVVNAEVVAESLIFVVWCVRQNAHRQPHRTEYR